jgi:hypothetical protein
MKEIKKIAGYNLLIVLIIMILLRVFSITSSGELDESNQQYGNLGTYILAALIVLMGFLVNITLGIIYFAKKDKELGRAFLLSAFLVLLVGFSSCITILNA